MYICIIYYYADNEFESTILLCKEHKRICKRQGRMETVCCCGNGSQRPVIAEKKNNN